jgi:hypothetical protein
MVLVPFYDAYVHVPAKAFHVVTGTSKDCIKCRDNRLPGALNLHRPIASKTSRQDGRREHLKVKSSEHILKDARSK